MLRLAIPNKGRLHDDARSLLADAGLEVRAASDRALVASLGGEFEGIFVRAQDIPELVADGSADAGITGWDLVQEADRGLVSQLDLGFGRCRLVVAAREESGIRTLDDLAEGTRIATVFPRVTARFFAERGKAVTLVPVSGAVEAAPHLGIADVILDLTSSGSTLRVNGLREVATVLESTAHLVVAGDDRAPRRRRPTCSTTRWWRCAPPEGAGMMCGARSIGAPCRLTSPLRRPYLRGCGVRRLAPPDADGKRWPLALRPCSRAGCCARVSRRMIRQGMWPARRR